MIKELDDKKIRTQLRRWRIDLGLKQKELAQQLGVGLMTINNIERGRAGLTLQNAVLYARFFGASMDKVLCFSDDKEPSVKVDGRTIEIKLTIN